MRALTRSLALCGAASLVACSETAPVVPDASDDGTWVAVRARAETERSNGDPDDVAIWVHPLDPARSLILSTDKEAGFVAYDLEGRVVQTVTGLRPNNIDLRYGFVLGETTYAIATSGDRADDSLTIVLVDEQTGAMSLAPGSGTRLEYEPYGSCMYRSARDGAHYVFVNAKTGAFHQYRLEVDAQGAIVPREVRSFALESQPEGCVADDEHGLVFLGEEGRGVHWIGAEPDAGNEPALLDDVASGRLTADVEGLAIHRGSDGGGYLLVSSQGSHRYVVYQRRAPHEYVGAFRLVDGDVDAATETDGIEVTHVALGPAYPEGLFVAQDDHDEGFTRGFKLASWSDIAAAFDPPLVVDTGAPLGR